MQRLASGLLTLVLITIDVGVVSGATLPAHIIARRSQRQGQSSSRTVAIGEHLRGDATAPVTLLEYGDFECPFSKQHTSTLERVLATYPRQVNVMFRNFPLSFHANAKKEAEAAECAAEIGGNDAFWKFHDAIFRKTTSGGRGFELDGLTSLAAEIGLDSAKFNACLTSGRTSSIVEAQIAAGRATGVTGTPTTFVVKNASGKGNRFRGAVSFADLELTVEEALGRRQ